MDSLTHKSNSREVSQLHKITSSFLPQNESIHEKVISAEVKITGFVLDHNLPLDVADHVGPLFRSMFPDSKIAGYYGCARTKTACIINRAMATEISSHVTELVQKQPFTLRMCGW